MSARRVTWAVRHRVTAWDKGSRAVGGAERRLPEIAPHVGPSETNVILEPMPMPVLMLMLMLMLMASGLIAQLHP